ncbi:hypothetical protein [Corallococcus sp. CA047B]|uniref:hypothetical protein n=1 Tax=Corallococcus sp. CA047B TaxID=2316729 RepID=UPI0011C41AEF|nr:hypothetical protein [Corallococcus sp. CA047B]
MSNAALKLSRSYKKSLTASLRPTNPSQRDDWERRFSLCSEHLLSAVVFRETAFGTFQKNGSAILPFVGIYYSLFHMGVAMLSIDCATKPGQVKHMGHARLQELLKEKLVKRGLLKARYVRDLGKAQVLRERVNYVVGGKRIDDPHFLKKAIPVWHEKTGGHFQDALKFINAVKEEYTATPGALAMPIAATIGDDIGDEVYSMYLSGSD